MNELYENGIANEIRKYQFEKKLTPKELFNEKKKVCLLDNGIELDDELNNIEEEGNMSEEIKEEENEENERCEVLKGDVDKSKYLKGKNNVITEEIEEVEEANENQ